MIAQQYLRNEVRVKIAVASLRSFNKSISSTALLPGIFTKANDTHTKSLPPKGSVPMIKGKLPQRKRLPGIKHIIACSSAKGGVGKSTVAANLALALSKLNHSVGLLDVDIFGPSIPKIVNMEGEEPRATAENRVIPLNNYGIKLMSMGFLIPKDAAVVWRGLMVVKALEQLLYTVEWGALDYLVVDMPPGTGDVQLTISQRIIIDGAVIISTPQEVALNAASRGLEMFRKVDVPIIGMVENMSGHECPNCHHIDHIFGSSGVSKAATRLGVPYLGNIPLDRQICTDCENGKPSIISDPNGAPAKAYMEITKNILTQLSKV